LRYFFNLFRVISVLISNGILSILPFSQEVFEMKKHLVVAAVIAAVFSAVPVFAGVNIFITPPPIPVPVLPPPPVPVAVMPPPPPGVVIGPSYWYWNGDRGSWFYYDRYRHPVYVRRHVFVDDGRHFYSEGGRWRPARHDMGRHRGWRERDERGHGRGRGHDRD
jgi:hypothetical protein